MRYFDKKTKELSETPTSKEGGISLKDEPNYHEYDKDRKFMKDARKKKAIKKVLNKHGKS